MALSSISLTTSTMRSSTRRSAPCAWEPGTYGVPSKKKPSSTRYLLLGPTRQRKPHRVRDMVMTRVSFLSDKWPVSRRAGFATWSFVSAFVSVHPTMRFSCLLPRVHARGIQVLSVEHELRARPRCNHTRGPGNAPASADASSSQAPRHVGRTLALLADGAVVVFYFRMWSQTSSSCQCGSHYAAPGLACCI
jgi:hypothetical protein